MTEPILATRPPLAGTIRAFRNPAAEVDAVLSVPDNHLDHARTKLAIDKMIDPSFDEAAVMAELDRMAETACGMVRPPATDAAKLAALRKLI